MASSTKELSNARKISFFLIPTLMLLAGGFSPWVTDWCLAHPAAGAGFVWVDLAVILFLCYQFGRAGMDVQGGTTQNFRLRFSAMLGLMALVCSFSVWVLWQKHGAVRMVDVGGMAANMLCNAIAFSVGYWLPRRVWQQPEPQTN